jgi:hypothetical protein
VDYIQQLQDEIHYDHGDKASACVKGGEFLDCFSMGIPLPVVHFIRMSNLVPRSKKRTKIEGIKVKLSLCFN